METSGDPMNRNRRILILCRYYGGHGGEENYVRCMLDALSEWDCDVFVTYKLSTTGMLPRARQNLRVELFNPLRFLAHLSRFGKHTSIFFAFSPYPSIGLRFACYAVSRWNFPKVIVPAGNNVQAIAQHFDRIAWEVDNAADYGLAGYPRNIVLYPPALHPDNLSQNFLELTIATPFYLTVFNPYNNTIKGTSLLYSIAEQSHFPILWCSNADRDYPPIPNKLYPIRASRNLVLALMSQCRAYLCLSMAEGFAWSILEAMIRSRPIISHPIGVASEYSSQIITWRDKTDLIHALNIQDMPASVYYDLSRFEPSRFLQALDSLVHKPD